MDECNNRMILILQTGTCNKKLHSTARHTTSHPVRVCVCVVKQSRSHFWICSDRHTRVNDDAPTHFKHYTVMFKYISSYNELCVSQLNDATQTGYKVPSQQRNFKQWTLSSARGSFSASFEWNIDITHMEIRTTGPESSSFFCLKNKWLRWAAVEYVAICFTRSRWYKEAGSPPSTPEPRARCWPNKDCFPPL